MRRTMAIISFLATVAFASFGAWATPTPVVINHGATVAFVGDSTSHTVTGWYNGGFITTVNAALAPVPAPPATFTGLKATFTGLKATVNRGTTAPPIVVVDGGISGNTVANLDSRISALLTANTPSVVFIAVGTNDILFGTDPSAFSASYADVLSKIQAYQTGTPVACLSIYMRGEQWGAGPVWVDATSIGFPAGTNALVDQFNGLISAACAAAGAIFIDTRSQFLQAEIISNPSQLGDGVFTMDGIHLIAAGQAAIIPFVMSSITVN